MRIMKTYEVLLIVTLLIGLARPCIAETNRLAVIRGRSTNAAPSELFIRIGKARTFLVNTQNADGSWGSNDDKTLETSIGLLAFGDIGDHWKYQESIDKAVQWLLQSPQPSDVNIRAARIIGAAQSIRYVNREETREALSTLIAADLRQLGSMPDDLWTALLVTSELPKGTVFPPQFPEPWKVIEEYRKRLTIDRLPDIKDLREFIVTTVNADYGPQSAKVAQDAQRDLWKMQNDDGSFPVTSSAYGKAAAVGLMFRTYRTWNHYGYRYLQRMPPRHNSADATNDDIKVDMTN
jgi:hypothetical protein